MISSAAGNLRVRTPEGIVFSFLLATPVTRSLAYAVDFACVSVICSMLGVVSALLGIFSLDIARAVSILIYFTVSIGYGMFTEWYWRGQTVGKRLLHLRVLDEQGMRLEFSQIAIRNLLRCVDMLPLFYAVGGITCALTRKAQRLGDLAASTIVVRNPPLSEPDLDQLAPDKWNSLREYPHLDARLRQRISPRVAAITLDAILRRAEFEAAERVTLFHDLAAHFKELVTFPPEATEGTTDEQYVRNVADILFR
jgi:uncharacterized RDD family membrane protein YckC